MITVRGELERTLQLTKGRATFPPQGSERTCFTSLSHRSGRQGRFLGKLILVITVRIEPERTLLLR